MPIILLSVNSASHGTGWKCGSVEPRLLAAPWIWWTTLCPSSLCSVSLLYKKWSRRAFLIHYRNIVHKLTLRTCFHICLYIQYIDIAAFFIALLSKELYDLPLIPSFLLVLGSVSWPRTLRHVELGIELPTLWSADDPLYLLSHER